MSTEQKIMETQTKETIIAETVAELEEAEALATLNKELHAKQLKREQSGEDIDEQLRSPERKDETTHRKSKKKKSGKNLLYSAGSPTQHLNKSDDSSDGASDAVVHAKTQGKSAAELKPSSPVVQESKEDEASPRVPVSVPHVPKGSDNPYAVLSGLGKKPKPQSKPQPQQQPKPKKQEQTEETKEAIAAVDAEMIDGDFKKVEPRKFKQQQRPAANVKFSCNHVFPDNEEFAELRAWYEECCHIAWNLTLEEAKQCILTVLQMIMKDPARQMENIKGKVAEGSTSASIGKFSQYAVVTAKSHFTYVAQTPSPDNIGVPVEQILKGFYNPALREGTRSVCHTISQAFIDLSQKISPVKVNGIHCLAIAKSIVPRDQKQSIYDYIGTLSDPDRSENEPSHGGDYFLIVLNFGTLGMKENEAKKFIDAQRAKFPQYKPANAGFRSHTSRK